MRTRMFGGATIVAAGVLVGACAVSFPEFGAEDGSGGSGVASTGDTGSTGGPSTTSGIASTADVGSTATTGGGGGASPSSSSGDGGGPVTSAGGEGGQGGQATSSSGGAGPCEGEPDGPIGGTDDPEDCRNHECLDGVEIDDADDAEDPPDANPPCELTICAGGQPTPDFADDGTSCGPAPQVCDGEGTCIGCDPDGPDSQCGVLTLCSAPTCEDDGTCDPGFLDDTTVLNDPVDGDCQRPECPGDNVNPLAVADDTDEPADLPCASAACSFGSSSFATLNEGTTCIGSSGVCDGLGNLAANCKTCRDTVGGANIDAGCNGTNPICDETSGTGVCRHCNDSAGGSATDLGCTDIDQVCNPAGIGTCVDCFTDGASVAVNCAVDEVCEPVGVGACRTCYDLGAGLVDVGCDSSARACDESNESCEECQDNADCVVNDNGPVCVNNGGTTCGCQVASDCTTSDRGHVCRLGAGPDFCGCNSFAGDCIGIPGATGCTANVCMCGASPC